MRERRQTVFSRTSRHLSRLSPLYQLPFYLRSTTTVGYLAPTLPKQPPELPFWSPQKRVRKYTGTHHF